MKPRLRLAVLDRDDWTCQDCHGPGQEVHHVEFKGMGGRHNEAKVKSEGADNLVTLCIPCHKTRHGER